MNQMKEGSLPRIESKAVKHHSFYFLLKWALSNNIEEKEGISEVIS